MMPMPNRLPPTAFEEIRGWVSRNARPLDFALWRYHFEGGCAEDVLRALALYQNADGGFGKGIEPDNWNPESTPYNAHFALGILEEIGLARPGEPMAEQIFQYLLDTPYRGEQGWLFSVPGNDRFPHAIWWTYSEEGSVRNGIGLTGNLVGEILRAAKPGSPIHALALTYAERLMDGLRAPGEYGDMGLKGYLDLLQGLRAAGQGDRFDLLWLEEKTRALLAAQFGQIVWSNHIDMAGIFPTPQSPFYSDHEQAVEQALTELIALRPSGGVWPIPWTWYDGGAYRDEFAIAENWWKASKATEKLLFLKAHGRLCEVL
jgi:hypothetical protein